MTKKKLLDFLPAVDGSSIPQQNHWTPEVFEQAFKESPDIQTVEIAGAKSKIKGQTPFFRRHRESTDRRNSVLLIKMVKKGSLAFGRPGTGDVGNKQKSGFIKENQMGPKSFGFFLYEASGNASNGQFLLRPFAMLGARVSDNSIPCLPGASRRGKDDIEPRTLGRSLWLPALGSIGLSDNRRPGVPSEAPLPIGSSETSTAWVDVPEWVGGEVHVNPSLGMSGTSETPSLPMHLRPVLLPTDFCPLLTAGWPAGAAFPTAVRFHRVSCIVLYTN
jgi:hypothetical protein